MIEKPIYPQWMTNLAALMLTIKGGMNGVFIVSLLVAISAWPFRASKEGLYSKQDVWLYTRAMFSLSIAIFISESYWQNYSGKSHDASVRYWLAVPIFLWLSRMSPQVFRALPIAFPVAAIAGFLLTDGMWGRRVSVRWI